MDRACRPEGRRNADETADSLYGALGVKRARIGLTVGSRSKVGPRARMRGLLASPYIRSDRLIRITILRARAPRWTGPIFLAAYRSQGISRGRASTSDRSPRRGPAQALRTAPVGTRPVSR